ncbi:paraquat-inducible protein A [Methylomagnum ishizawai]|uniref:Paraquat-inducible protein A n=1 Tax=Methylomagnum ishizawai TaxID=1760988 RepID=A0A1Y6CYA3_9GAMM|nr:paraquat-inducible protein A [Methylomagnum ishizawai]SMF93553.1 paraquat-inducible protein A [Methylomagnum ishizawai]
MRPATQTPAQHHPHWIACHDCDALYPVPRLAVGQKALCVRCGAVLLQRKRDTLGRSLAMAFACLVLFTLANSFPLLGLNIEGRVEYGAVISGVFELKHQGFSAMAALVFGVSILAPGLKIAGWLYVLLPLRLNRRLPGMTTVFRWIALLGPWAMAEVYMLGILVAVVKLADLATIEPGLSLYSFAAMIVAMAATDAMLEPHEIWERLESLK